MNRNCPIVGYLHVCVFGRFAELDQQYSHLFELDLSYKDFREKYDG